MSVQYRKALKNYAKQRADMIDLKINDVIEQLGANQNGWCKGKNTRTGMTGWFPFAQTAEITSDEAKQLQDAYEDDEYDYDDYYEDEEEEEEEQKPAAKPAAQAQKTAGVSNEELQKLQQQIEQQKQEIEKLKANQTVENIIKFQLNESETNNALNKENEELKQKILELEQKLVDQRAQNEQLVAKNQKLQQQIKLFEAQEDKVNQYESEKAQLLQSTQNKLKEKDLQLQTVEGMIKGSEVGSDIAAQLQEVQEKLYSLEMENYKLGAEIACGKGRLQGGKYRVKMRKQPKNRQNINIDVDAVKAQIGGR